MSLGIAIIAKNEEESLPALLNSINGLAEQVVIIDTGSSDNTVRKAIEFNAEIYFADWKDDFSYARNIALSHLRTDWVLSLDCDEIIEEKDHIKIKKIISDTNAGGINIMIENSLGKGIKSVHNYTRLFRNLPGIRYTGRVHEQIRKSIENKGLEIIESDIKIIHNGYFENDINKQVRNKNLLLKEIQENPDDAWLKYHLANTEFAMKNLNTAEELFNSVCKSPALTTSQKEMSLIRLAQISLAKNNFHNIIKHLDFTSNNQDREGLRRFIYAAALMINGDLAESAEMYKSIADGKSKLVDYTTVKNAINLLNKKLN